MSQQREIRTIDLDVPRRLLYTPKNASQAEQVLGESFHESIRKLGFQRMHVWLWAGLKFFDQKLTVTQVEDISDKAFAKGVDYNAVWDAITDAMVASNLFKMPRQSALDEHEEVGVNGGPPAVASLPETPPGTSVA